MNRQVKPLPKNEQIEEVHIEEFNCTEPAEEDHPYDPIGRGFSG